MVGVILLYVVLFVYDKYEDIIDYYVLNVFYVVNVYFKKLDDVVL